MLMQVVKSLAAGTDAFLMLLLVLLLAVLLAPLMPLLLRQLSDVAGLQLVVLRL